ncbi:MAG: MFS transporter [Pseudomonadota bacterium]
MNESWFHPSRRPYRFTVLVIVALVMAGSYFAYDSVGAIEDTLMKKMGIGQSEIGTMYSMYSWAAIFTLFGAGLLTDYIGARRSSILFSLLIAIGAVIVAWAPNLWVLYLGRFIFGAGCEALYVCQNAIIVRWFKGKELALAFGLALTFARLGTLFTFNTEALIADRWGPIAALYVAAGLCVLSFLVNFLYVGMDRVAEPVLKLKQEGAGDRIVWSEVWKFSPSFWYLTMLCVLFYSAVFPFTALSTNFFHEKWQLPLTVENTGGFLGDIFKSFMHMFSTAPGTTSIVIFASMVFAPFAGGLIDKIGRRASLMLVGSVLLIVAHVTMGLTNIAPRWPMMILGAGFVLVPAAIWPAVALVVPKERVGTAYGLMAMVQNVGLMLFPWLNGVLREKSQNYEASMMMFACLGIAGLVFAYVLLRNDKRSGGVLERAGQ